jgi:hypothetical protein
VVIGIDCMGSDKSNYLAIMTTTVPHEQIITQGTCIMHVIGYTTDIIHSFNIDLKMRKL